MEIEHTADMGNDVVNILDVTENIKGRLVSVSNIDSKNEKISRLTEVTQLGCLFDLTLKDGLVSGCGSTE
jgi:hypothetical protein